jgi:hypothetical protein
MLDASFDHVPVREHSKCLPRDTNASCFTAAEGGALSFAKPSWASSETTLSMATSLRSESCAFAAAIAAAM